MGTMTRRKFISATGRALAAAPLAGLAGTLAGCTRTRPNILVLMVDQMRTPPEGYGDGEGEARDMKEIMGFRPLSPENAYAQYFPGMLRLRKNGVVMRKHHTASAACVPSRASIMTGQYPSVTGVTETDGMFKSPHDVPFLDPDGLPTIGDWFRAAGYGTHYFGKWHVSEVEETDYLEPWGFADWEQSYPEPHAGGPGNLGVYRDVEFTNSIIGFLGQKAGAADGAPWLAVGSLVNPHDNSAYPINWQTPNNTGVENWTHYPPPLPVPAPGSVSRVGGMNEQNAVELNPDGFPQECGSLPGTFGESLADKPRCQRDYALKWGLATESSTNYGLQGTPFTSPQPFQLNEGWSLSYNQFYFYCNYLADLQLRRILQSLDESGLAENTIVVFLSDHGELAGAHGGMIQKWHNAYEETVRVPMIVSSPLVNRDAEEMREIQQPTSSIDLLPTLLGLAGLCESRVRRSLEDAGITEVPSLPGADLSPHVRGFRSGKIKGPDGRRREGVFFMTSDTITAKGPNPDAPKPAQYEMFLANVEARISQGHDIQPGSVCQPNNVRAFCTGDWKIARYVDTNGVEADEWELYCLTSDPVEAVNLVDYRTGELRDGVEVPGLPREELEGTRQWLREELSRQEAAASVA